MDPRGVPCLDLLVGLLLLAPAAVAAADIPYAVADWQEAGRGNHRAVVRVGQPAPAVLAELPWRRRDVRPEAKDVRVYAATGRRVLNVAALTVTREAGRIAFEPVSGAGEYEIYWLPYDPPVSHFDAQGDYFPPTDSADAAWRASVGDGTALPSAEVLRFEARGEFQRFDPMEVPATAAEVASLRERLAAQPFAVFAEDRARPVRMKRDLPRHWAAGEITRLALDARPSECYVFQIGVWAHRDAVELRAADLADWVGPAGRLAAAGGTCFNLGGNDWLGRPFRRAVTVPAGSVQALWFGVMVPPDARGGYRGAVTLRDAGGGTRRVDLDLTVSGEPLADHGDGDLARLARLRWLNSTVGVDDEVIAPYTPLRLDGPRVELLGRAVEFGPLGLPAAIVSNQRAVLAAPTRLVVETAAGEVRWTPGSARWTRRAPAGADRRTGASGDGLDLTVFARIEADGYLMLNARLTARRDVALRDVRLELPLARDVARYFMGFGRRGGRRPETIDWRWDLERANNEAWIGDVSAGLQLRLATAEDRWETLNLKQTGLPESWHNGGAGGCRMTTEPDQVRVTAFSGPRRMLAGETLDFRFRLLVTPFRPVDPRHWRERHGSFADGATVLHVHHGTPQNPYINYPFLTAAGLKALVDQAATERYQRVDPGELSYPIDGGYEAAAGSLHLWTRINFDPTVVAPGQARFNQPLASIDLPGQDSLAIYWNIDDHGPRAYVRDGAPELNRYPVLLPTGTPDWREGQRCLVTLSWGERFEIFVDGRRVGSAPYRGSLPRPAAGARLHLRGGFALSAVKIDRRPYAEGRPIVPTIDEDTLFLDTFAAVDGEVSRPERAPAGCQGAFTGTIERGADGREIVFSARRADTGPKGVNVYYTVRELTNRLPELWPLRSLGDEIFPTSTPDRFQVGDTSFGTGGGYAWLREHLEDDYVVGWRNPLPGGDTDAAIATQGLSRWHNYYVEGLGWLMRETGVDGLYLDGIGYDRQITKRVAKVMARTNPNYRINFHGGDGFSPPWDPDRRVSTANRNLEHFPYLTSLWFGELFDYDAPPDYWLTEISGLPFGLTSEMLNYEHGGNPYRGMIFGMSGRQHPSAPAMWRLWDSFGIEQAEMIGYWDDACPVRTDTPEVLATVYRRPERSLIALAHWPAGDDARPEAVVARADASPAADGRLAPATWADAARLARFRVLGSREPASLPMAVQVAWSPQRLHVRWRCATGGTPPKADSTGRDGAVYEDDAVELFVQPDPDQPEYFQFVGNSAGVFADFRGQDASWDADWNYVAAVEAEAWTGELSIPWSALGVEPGDGRSIGFNVCRDQQRPARQLTTWAPLKTGFHDPQRFGRLRLAAGGATRESDPTTAPDEPLAVRLAVDWRALGLAAERVGVVAPAIDHFQPPAEYAVAQPIPVLPSRGAILWLEERRR